MDADSVNTLGNDPQIQEPGILRVDRQSPLVARFGFAAGMKNPGRSPSRWQIRLGVKPVPFYCVMAVLTHIPI